MDEVEVTERPVLLYSGGLDSFILADQYPAARLLYVNFGGRYQNKELTFGLFPRGREIIFDERLSLRDQEREDHVVPGRNLLMAVIASYYGPEVLLGTTSGDAMDDQQPAFGSAMNEMFRIIYGPGTNRWTRRPVLRRPFLGASKVAVVGLYLESGADASQLSRCISCYHPTLLHCGQCSACFRKWVALTHWGIDETHWAVPPVKQRWPGVCSAIKAGKYRQGRETEETMYVLKMTGLWDE